MWLSDKGVTGLLKTGTTGNKRKAYRIAQEEKTEEGVFRRNEEELGKFEEVSS